MHDLLDEPLIGIRTPEGKATRVSLPELLARLSSGDFEAYTGLRPHQADPWHVFLVQIAASVLARHPEIDPSSPPREAAFWREGLLDLADGQASAWQLVVEDLSLPAFLQQPLPGCKDALPEAFQLKATSADKLDVLVTSKNHDLKANRVAAEAVEPWLYSLLCLQTLSGVMGSGNYGSVRMNGGLGSRAIVSTVSQRGQAARFVEELHLLCAMRASIRSHGFGYQERACVLTWLLSWGREAHQCTLQALEPYFIEAVRPVRLMAGGGCIQAWGATSKARQIGPKVLETGLVGDPWTAINTGDKKKGRSALTLSASGWTPERMTALLFEQDFELTPLQRPRPSQGDLYFIGSVVVRGQGTTDGFHRFCIPLPAKARLSLLRRESAQTLGAFGLDLIKDAREAERALEAALFALAQGGPEQVDFKQEGLADRVGKASEGFRTHWSERYFDTLWQAIEPDARAAQRAQWQAALVDRARSALQQAESRLPLPLGRRWRALTRAAQLLQARLRKAGLLPATPNPSPTNAEEDNLA